MRLIHTIRNRDHQGDRFPWWLGKAWDRYDVDAVVLMPIPLNWLAGAARRLWLAIYCGVRPGKLDQLRAANAGWERRYNALLRQLKDGTT